MSRNLKHGDSNKLLYRRWAHIKERCLSPKSKDYHKYGAKGITICQEWLNYLVFKEWALRNGYRDELTIDRIEGTKGYSPDNCRWVGHYVQNINKKDFLKNSTGFTGVRLTKNKLNPFAAAISIDKKIRTLGYFKTPEEASAVYEKAKEERNKRYLATIKK